MNNKYVFDACTLILLAKVTVLRSFAKVKPIFVSKVVKAEIFKKKDADDCKIVEQLIQEGLIQELHSKPSKKIEIDFKLGIGEAESLQLAFESRAVLATDDWRAIKACKILDMKFVTAIHCLIYLVRHDKIDKNIAIEKLKNLEKYGRYNNEIIKNAQKIIQGDKNG